MGADAVKCCQLLHFQDKCPEIFDPGQSDGEGDGVGDACDNCPSAHNPKQENEDKDIEGDACDADMDNDEISKIGVLVCRWPTSMTCESSYIFKNFIHIIYNYIVTCHYIYR